MDLHSEAQRTQSEEDMRSPKTPQPLHDLHSYVPSLSTHVGEVIVSLDSALELVGEPDWTPETQAAVRRAIGLEMISGYVEGSNLLQLPPAMLEAEARTHLARFAIATSILLTEREKRDRACES